MRHTPCGCRSACLVEVQTNFRLPEHSSMRRAQQCRYFASSLPPSKRHSSLTTVRRGCCQVATRRDSWRSHVHRTHTAQRVQPFKLQTRNGGVKGQSPLRSLGGPRGPVSHVREWPPFPYPPRVWGTRIREGYLFFEKRYLSLSPSQRKFPLQAGSSKSCNACRLHYLRAALPR